MNKLLEAAREAFGPGDYAFTPTWWHTEQGLQAYHVYRMRLMVAETGGYTRCTYVGNIERFSDGVFEVYHMETPERRPSANA